MVELCKELLFNLEGALMEHFYIGIPTQMRRVKNKNSPPSELPKP